MTTDVRPVLSAATTMDELVAASALFEQVWGRTAEGVPMPSEVLRSLVHAGGLVTLARLEDELVAAAAVGRGLPGTCYGYLAASRPGLVDRGLGFAIKQHQREWALGAAMHAMEWTFDPLVARNARFNLTKLGAHAAEYEVAFYGEMHDAQNAGEVGDRLVAHWTLTSPRAARAARGRYDEPASPRGPSRMLAPDGEPIAWAAGEDRWIRVPHDIQALRRTDPDRAKRWRFAVRDAFTAALADGWYADGMGRDSIYHLSRGVQT